MGALLLAEERIIPWLGLADPVSAISHLVGAVAFGYLTPRLVRRGRGSPGRVLALGVFAVSCIVLLSVSGVYHVQAEDSPARALFQRLDHAAIYALIAGTFTAGHAILFRGLWRWGMIALIWSLALAGILMKTVFFESVSEGLGLASYLGLGWIGIVSGVRVERLYGATLFRPLFAGGAAYTVGAVLEFLRWPELVPGHFGAHELFHVLVLGGVGCHWLFAWRFADGQVPRREPPPREELASAARP